MAVEVPPRQQQELGDVPLDPATVSSSAYLVAPAKHNSSIIQKLRQKKEIIKTFGNENGKLGNIPVPLAVEVAAPTLFSSADLVAAA